MLTLLDVLLPIFLLLGFGYVAAWRAWITENALDAVMLFVQKFAVPCLLFRGVAQLDLSVSFQPTLLFSFYSGALICFSLGLFGSRLLFKRSWEDCVAIGFVCLFSNTVLMGLPITERAYGTDALTANFVIITFHAAFCYGIGITVMEIVRARGSRAALLVPKVLSAMFRNALILGVVAGILVNISGFAVPAVLGSAVDLMAQSALPTALFGLGGVVYRYRPAGDGRVIAMVLAISLLIHPSLVWVFGSSTGLSQAYFRSAVVTAAMAPGVNAYLFADMYGAGKRVAASSVLIGTGLTLFTAWFWLGLLA